MNLEEVMNNLALIRKNYDKYQSYDPGIQKNMLWKYAELYDHAIRLGLQKTDKQYGVIRNWYLQKTNIEGI